MFWSQAWFHYGHRRHSWDPASSLRQWGLEKREGRCGTGTFDESCIAQVCRLPTSLSSTVCFNAAASLSQAPAPEFNSGWITGRRTYAKRVLHTDVGYRASHPSLTSCPRLPVQLQSSNQAQQLLSDWVIIKTTDNEIVKYSHDIFRLEAKAIKPGILI